MFIIAADVQVITVEVAIKAVEFFLVLCVIRKIFLLRLRHLQGICRLLSLGVCHIGKIRQFVKRFGGILVSFALPGKEFICVSDELVFKPGVFRLRHEIFQLILGFHKAAIVIGGQSLFARQIDNIRYGRFCFLHLLLLFVGLSKSIVFEILLSHRGNKFSNYIAVRPIGYRPRYCSTSFASEEGPERRCDSSIGFH